MIDLPHPGPRLRPLASLQYAFALALVAALLAQPAHGEDSLNRPAPIPVASDGLLPAATTHHAIRLGSGKLIYRATWFEIPLVDAEGSAAASISATAYIRADTDQTSDRPVIFMFNGGPGASSSPLHMHAFGPRILGERNSPAEHSLTDNPDTLLDIADLVFIDPVGTGFSRPLRPGGGRRYWSVDGDADAALSLIRRWLINNQRMSSPIYIVGESYGGYRLGTMAPKMIDLNVAGLILISPALDFGSNKDQTAIEALPTIAVAAWWHRSRTRQPEEAKQVWERARAFAQTDYAAALQLGTAIDPATKSLIGSRLAVMTGISTAEIEANGLHIDSEYFLEGTVPGCTLGRLDVRVLAPKRTGAPDRPTAANDPALGLGRTNVIISSPIRGYFTEDLGVKTSRDYYSLTLDVNFSWDWSRSDPRPGHSWNVADGLGALLKARPRARLLALSGYYDLATPALAVRYAIDHSSIPRDRTQTEILPVGHSVAEGEAGRRETGRILRAFIIGAR